MHSRWWSIAFWRTAGQDLDYRRFFDINTLVSLRMEDERVVHETHGLVLEWVEEQGGRTAMGERNRAKAELLYGAIDRSDFYSTPVTPDASTRAM